MALQSLILPIVSIFRSMGITQARQGIAAITKDFGAFSKQIGMAAGSFAAFSALTTARQFTVDAVEATQRFERNILALGQVFETAKPQIVAFTREVESYGLSQSQAAQASVFLGSVLKQYGFSTSESADQTQRLVTLAQDLATTYGYDVQEALLAITALFRGEYDPIEKFGVAMKQNEINAERVARGLGHLTGAAQMQADAQIRLDLLFQRAGDSMGAFTRATDTLYGSQQLLNAALQNLMISAGAPLQKPLAEVNNLLADLIGDMGPEITDVFEAIGGAIETVGPTVEKLARSVLNIVGVLEQLVGLIDLVLKPVFMGLNIILDVVNSGLGMLNDLLNALTGLFTYVSLRVRQFGEELKKTPLKPVIEGFEWLMDNGLGIGAALDFIGDQFRQASEATDALNGDFIEYEGNNRAASTAARAAAAATRRLNEELEQQEQRLKNAANASLEYLDYLESIGASVGRSDFYVADKGDATDYIGDFFGSIRDAVAKEQARLKLDAMGASEGLIEAILGAQGWETVYKKIVRDGVKGLKDLQEEFNKTAAGIDELTAALEEAEKAQQALRDAAQAMIDENIRNLQAAYDEAKRYFDQVQARADEFRRWSLDNIATVQILPDFERELGKFESAITSTISGIQSQLTAAVRSGLIFEDDFASLQRWVNTESAALFEIARRRDELANRYALSESLIREYQNALTGSLKLTTLFGRLKDETETKTVTEVSQGVVRLGAELREFGITVTRSYEETIENVANKTEGLLTGFRDMAVRARDFAENLRKLRDMGLDPMLFNQLVQAGAEAGGETAQAIIDGGQDSVNELNSIFQEINELGAQLGMDVGYTMYEAGQDITYGLLDGLQSEQERLYEMAMEMAKTFSETFKANLDIAIEAPVAAAKQVAQAAEQVLEEAKTANVEALTQINSLIQGAEKALAGPLSSAFRTGVETKLGAFRAVQTDILSGQVQSLGGLTTGMSSARVEELLRATGGTTVNNYYNVQVSADTRTGGAKAGEALVDTLTSYTFANGNDAIVKLSN